jgi:hypothetical protein
MGIGFYLFSNVIPDSVLVAGDTRKGTEFF